MHDFKAYKPSCAYESRVLVALLLPINQMGGWWMFPAFFMIIPLAWFVVGILILVWVYQDAESRGMNGVLWTLITFFLSIIGLILYLVVRESNISEPQRITRVCPKCGRVLSEDAKFCPRCGKELA